MWRERVSEMEIKITGNKKLDIINRMNNISKVIEIGNILELGSL